MYRVYWPVFATNTTDILKGIATT